VLRSRLVRQSSQEPDSVLASRIFHCGITLDSSEKWRYNAANPSAGAQ